MRSTPIGKRHATPRHSTALRAASSATAAYLCLSRCQAPLDMLQAHEAVLAHRTDFACQCCVWIVAPKPGQVGHVNRVSIACEARRRQLLAHYHAHDSAFAQPG